MSGVDHVPEFPGLTPPQQGDETLPTDDGKPVYVGHFVDRHPQLDTAGTLTRRTGTVAECLHIKPRPPSPEVIRRFHAKFIPRHGAIRVHYGQAYDKERVLMAGLRHGVPTRLGITAGELVNPPLKTRFSRHVNDVRERVYDSRQNKPLGRTHDQTPGLPKGLDPLTYTFGVWSEQDISAGQLINPNINPPEVDAMNLRPHDLYKLSHNDYFPGEQSSRDYAHPSYDRHRCYGMPTPHDNEGSATRKSLRWLQHTQAAELSPITSRIEDEFRERSQFQLGKGLDPIRDTLVVPTDHSFGYKAPAEPYGVGELIHYRPPERFLRGRQQDRSVLAVIRNHLKKANHRCFDNLLHAFKFYDKEQKGHISKQNLYETCLQFHLPMSADILDQLFDYCDVDHDGMIDYVEFSNFLNWKDMMPSGFPNPCYPPCGLRVANAAPKRLVKQVDCPYGDQSTTSSMINGGNGVSPLTLRKYGIPSIRSDRPAPRIRKVDDATNYGDMSDVWGLINPSVFSNHEIYERDVLAPRPPEELQVIFANIGVKMTCETFNNLYSVAAERSPKGEVSVDSFRGVLDEALEDTIHKYRDTLRYSS